MLDNLRDDGSTRPFFEEEEEPAPPPEAAPALVRVQGTKFLGMTPIQRFVISVLIMMTVCVLGTMFLLVTEKIGIYF
jgi:hypothetical protein